MTTGPQIQPLSVLPRAASALFSRSLKALRVVVVTGPRQAGKSTFVEHCRDLADRPYFSLDDAATLRRAKDNPTAFARSAERMTIDEVQRAPDLILAIKSVVDRQRPSLRGQFVLTGSANLLMMKQVGDSLAGRATYLRLWPMTRREQLGLGTTGSWSDFFLKEPKHWLRDANSIEAQPAAWREQCMRGGFPEVAAAGGGLQQDGRELWFDGYITTYLERDLRDLAAVGDLGDFQRLMQASALRIGNLLNQSELGRDVQLPAMTVHRYLNLLETSYQIIRLPPYAVNRTKRLIKTPKLYWNDSALALHLGSGGGAGPTGAHFENFVLCDLLAWRDLQTPKAEVTYWRTASGYEVDFVLEWQKKLIGVEVKAAQPNLRDVQGLRAFLAEHPRTARGGVVIHGGDESYWLDDQIIALPWWRVM